MAFEKICTLADIREGDMRSFLSSQGTELLLVGLPERAVLALHGRCPHQNFSLLHAKQEGRMIVCRAHGWRFDVRTGRGIHPPGCALTRFPTKVDGDTVYVDVESGTR